MRAGAAELIGTCVLVLAVGATAVALATTNPPLYDLTSIVPAFGLALTALVAALGHVSGCHLNPAVSVGLAVIGKFPWRAVPVYVLAHLVGAVLASLATWAAYSGRGRQVIALSTTSPADGVSAGGRSSSKHSSRSSWSWSSSPWPLTTRMPAAVAPVAVGSVLAVCIFIAAPPTGGAVNPARAFGSAVVSGDLHALWVYLLAPLVGGVLAAVLYDRVLAPAQAPAPAGGTREEEAVELSTTS
ncbi:MIP/aquaporin family protein [Kineococcus sp. DHX-1]|uniref:MIP/aquaporin family protein n=1 Tax=Kineococcus sp. DHX-1 TaxID=3349638 RepID=UPI0036D430D8